MPERKKLEAVSILIGFVLGAACIAFFAYTNRSLLLRVTQQQQSTDPQIELETLRARHSQEAHRREMEQLWFDSFYKLAYWLGRCNAIASERDALPEIALLALSRSPGFLEEQKKRTIEIAKEWDSAFKQYTEALGRARHASSELSRIGDSTRVRELEIYLREHPLD